LDGAFLGEVVEGLVDWPPFFVGLGFGVDGLGLELALLVLGGVELRLEGDFGGVEARLEGDFDGVDARLEGAVCVPEKSSFLRTEGGEGGGVESFFFLGRREEGLRVLDMMESRDVPMEEERRRMAVDVGEALTLMVTALVGLDGDSKVSREGKEAASTRSKDFPMDASGRFLVRAFL